MVAYPPAPPRSPMLAGFWVRTLAYVLDAFLLSFVGGAFPYLVIYNSNPVNQPPGAAAGGAGGASLLISFIYFVLFWSYLGGCRTLGMRLFGLRVVEEDGLPVGMVTAIVRWVGLWISFAACFIGVIWVAGDSRQQGWHDKLAHTLVIHV
ncbi:MAG: RDD family protein [Candidatus Dormibacteraceae bacterium]